MVTINSEVLDGYIVKISRYSTGVGIEVTGPAPHIAEVYAYFCELYDAGAGYAKDPAKKDSAKLTHGQKIRQFKAIEAKKNR